MGDKVVKEFDAATKGKSLPKRAPHVHIEVTRGPSFTAGSSSSRAVQSAASRTEKLMRTSSKRSK